MFLFLTLSCSHIVNFSTPATDIFLFLILESNFFSRLVSAVVYVLFNLRLFPLRYCLPSDYRDVSKILLFVFSQLFCFLLYCYFFVFEKCVMKTLSDSLLAKNKIVLRKYFLPNFCSGKFSGMAALAELRIRLVIELLALSSDTENWEKKTWDFCCCNFNN